MSDIITLAHGSGGKAMHSLISEVFRKHLSNEQLDREDDAAQFDLSSGRYAFTTDSFVISPIIFNGGNIGKLSVCGTVNDLASAGAAPLYLSCGFIIEEGFSVQSLETIVSSMAETAAECGAKLVTGDTKVVGKGAADGIFINTSGIGLVKSGVNISGVNAKPGDKVIITGYIGDHGCSIMLEREKLGITAPLKSDCAPLSGLVQELLKAAKTVHVLRDPTRGGIATTLNEIASQSNISIKLYENSLPVRDEVRGVCELLGLDPLYVANEGKMLVIVPEECAKDALTAIRNHRYGKDACIIGEVEERPEKRVYVKTATGGGRILDMLIGDQLPRIC